MEPKINRVLMGGGLLAGLMLATGNAGAAIALTLAAAAGAWLMRTGPGQERSLW